MKRTKTAEDKVAEAVKGGVLCGFQRGVESLWVVWRCFQMTG